MILQKNELMNFSKISTVFLLLFFLFGCGDGNKKEKIENTLPLSFEGKVTGIKDGDNYIVFYNVSGQTNRLAHIDCPEKKQPFGTKAKQFASDFYFGKFVKLNHKDKYDRNNRLIPKIILTNGLNVNKELVNNGLAWHFKKYSNNQDYAELVVNARNILIGIRSEPNQIAPWDWRKKSTKITAI